MLSEFISSDIPFSLPFDNFLPAFTPALIPDTSQDWSALAPIAVLPNHHLTLGQPSDDLTAAFMSFSRSGEPEGIDSSAPFSDTSLFENTTLVAAQQALEDFWRSPTRDESLLRAFDDSDSLAQTQSLVEQLIAGDILPQVTFLPAHELGAQGAYAAANQTIYLSKELLAHPELTIQVFMEELGHFLDDHRSPKAAPDAPGDEGAIFAAEVLGDRLTAPELAALKAEDDTATLPLGYQTLAVERADFGPGTFTVGATGQISAEFWVDSGAYEGQLAIFDLAGMEGLAPGSPEFIAEAARRALSNSAAGYVVINDIAEAARLTGELGERDYNTGEAAGAKTGTFSAGAQVAVMLVPDGTVAEVLDNPTIAGKQRPLFSIASANPGGQIHIAEVQPGIFTMEDMRIDTGSDLDFNDVMFRIQGATAQVNAIAAIAGNQQIWVDTPFGQQLLLVPPDVLIQPETPINPPTGPASSPLGGLQVSIPSGVPKFNAGNSEAEIAATGAARLTLGTQTIYIGTNQVASNNQNPIIASFDSANPANNWIRADYEVTGTDGRGVGIAGDGTNLYAIFTVDGTQGAPSEDFRRAAADAQQNWLQSYGPGGGAKVSVLGRIDPSTGALLDAAYLSAILSNGNSNTLTVENLGTNTNGNLVVSAQSFFSPRRPDGSALTQTVAGSSPFAYTIEIVPDLSRVVSTSAPGWV